MPAPSFSGVIDTIGSKRGYLNTVDVTDDTRLALTGMGTIGQTVTIYDGDTQLGSATVGPNSYWLFHTDWLADKRTYNFRAADAGSNEFSAESYQITIDAPMPLAPQTPSYSLSKSVGNRLNVGAFAALKADGSVVTWGDAANGGNYTGNDLSAGVVRVFSSNSAFAALKADGSVVTWGNDLYGGNYTGNDLSAGVVQVFSSSIAFAALKADGSVVTWGHAANGGNYTGNDLSSGVVQVFSNDYAFAALKMDGSVVTWGDADSGGNSASADLSAGVAQVFSTGTAFAALKTDGSVVTWGGAANGGNYTGNDLSSGVVQVFSNDYAFAALKMDGSVVTWGDADSGGNYTGNDLSSGVVQVFSTGTAFAALKMDGSVVTWGDEESGGNYTGNDLSSGVAQVFSNWSAFAALKTDGSVVTWGDEGSGGNSADVDLSGRVAQVFSAENAFAALKTDGSVVTWGNHSSGGNSSTVKDQLKEVVGLSSPFLSTLLTANTAPAINGMPGTPAAVTVGTAAQLADFTVVDADNDALTVTLTPSNGAIGGLTAGANVNEANGVWTLTGTADTINTLLAGLTFTATAAGNASVAVSVNDGKAQAVTQTYSLTATANTAPAINGMPGTPAAVTVGTAAQLADFTVVDADNDALTVTLTPANGTIGGLTAGGNVNVANGVWTLTGTADAINALLAGLTFTATVAGNASVAVSVNDGKAQAVTQTYSLTATANTAPAINGMPGTPAAVTVGTAAQLADFTVVDADNDALTVTLTPANGAIGGLTTGANVNEANGVWTLTGTADTINTLLAGLTFTATAAGNASIAINVSDGKGGTASSTYKLNVGTDPTPGTPDTTAPSFVSAETNTNGMKITLTYDEVLHATTATASAFAVTMNGTPISVNGVSISGNTVELTLGSAVTAGQIVTVAYVAPPADAADTNAAIQDTTGNDAAQLSHRTVTNNSTVKPAPNTTGETGDAGSDNKHDVYVAPEGKTAASLSDNLSSYVLVYQDGRISISKPGSVADDFVGFTKLVFADGSIDLTTHSGLFDPVFYALQNLDVFKSGAGSWDHFQHFGNVEGRDPNPFFDIGGYLAANKDVAAAGVNALAHFIQYGVQEGRDTSTHFDMRLYLQHNPDVEAAGVNPLEHYLVFGRAEGRVIYDAIGDTIATDSFDEQHYLLDNADAAAAGVDARAHFTQFGFTEGRSANSLFEPAEYLARNADVAAAGVDPLTHYNEFGWREGRAASSHFDTQTYLAENPDVAAADINPLTHYLQFGIFEGRPIDDAHVA